MSLNRVFVLAAVVVGVVAGRYLTSGYGGFTQLAVMFFTGTLAGLGVALYTEGSR